MNILMISGEQCQKNKNNNIHFVHKFGFKITVYYDFYYLIQIQCQQTNPKSLLSD